MISSAAAAICSIRPDMSSTASPIRRKAARVCSTTAAPSCGAVRAILDDGDGLAGFALDRADQAGDLLGRALGLLGELADLLGDHGEPLPCSPARAASIAALSASRLVCSAIPVMVCTIAPICSDLAASSMASLTRPTMAHRLHRLVGLLGRGDALVGDLAGVVGDFGASPI